MNHSTAGLSASARKSEMRIHVSTCLEIQITSRATATAMMAKRTDRTVRSRNRTRRSWMCSWITPPRMARTPDAGRLARRHGSNLPPVSLRGRPIEKTATLPDGSEVQVRVGVPEDSYIPRRELDTVDIELFVEGRAVAAVNTVLSAGQDSQALQLAREIVSGLESGELEPTAAALEPLADQPR